MTANRNKIGATVNATAYPVAVTRAAVLPTAAQSFKGDEK